MKIDDSKEPYYYVHFHFVGLSDVPYIVNKGDARKYKFNWKAKEIVIEGKHYNVANLISYETTQFNEEKIKGSPRWKQLHSR